MGKTLKQINEKITKACLEGIPNLDDWEIRSMIYKEEYLNLQSELEDVKAERDKWIKELTKALIMSQYQTSYAHKDDLYYTPDSPESRLKSIGDVITNILDESEE